jgi:hypothetical protein
MENCLVTKLKASVQNDDLKVLGAIKIVVDPTEDAWANSRNIHILPLTDVELEAYTSDSYFVNSSGVNIGTTITITTAKDYVYFSTAGGTYYVKNKYGISRLDATNTSIHPIIIDDFGYNDGLTRLSGRLSGNLSALAGKTVLNHLVTNNDVKEITGKLDSLADCTAITNLQLTAQNKITPSDIAVLGKLTNLTTLGIGTTNTYGTIESFVARQRGAGRTTCDGISCNYIGADNPNLTFNGTHAPITTPLTLSWDATTISLGGVTINNSDVNPN